LRNKLKEQIKKLTNQTRLAKVTKPAGTPENTAIFDGKTYGETIVAVIFLMTTLRNFNISIEKANAVNKVDLITLESLKVEIVFYDVLAAPPAAGTRSSLSRYWIKRRRLPILRNLKKEGRERR
jgi:hypothetical protein